MKWNIESEIRDNLIKACHKYGFNKYLGEDVADLLTEIKTLETLVDKICENEGIDKNNFYWDTSQMHSENAKDLDKLTNKFDYYMNMFGYYLVHTVIWSAIVFLYAITMHVHNRNLCEFIFYKFVYHHISYSGYVFKNKRLQISIH